MNERLRILKLLENGKINADEAARLLEALGQSKTRERKGHFWSSIEVIPDIVSSAISDSFKGIISEEITEIPRKKKIEFKGISGDIEFLGTDSDTINIKKDGFARIIEAGDILRIKAISGDVKITAPEATDLQINGISGSLNISNINGEIELASVSGDIIGNNLSGSFVGEVVSGDINLSYGGVEKIRIKSKSGDVILKLSEKVEAELDIESVYGDINCEFELIDEEKNTHRLKGTINRPTAKIEIRNEHGDVKIEKRKSG